MYIFKIATTTIIALMIVLIAFFQLSEAKNKETDLGLFILQFVYICALICMWF